MYTKQFSLIRSSNKRYLSHAFNFDDFFCRKRSKKHFHSHYTYYDNNLKYPSKFLTKFCKLLLSSPHWRQEQGAKNGQNHLFWIKKLFKVAKHSFDTCVSPFSPNPLIPRSPKLAASKLTTQTLAFWWLRWRMCRCHGNMSKYKQAFKIGFVYL